MPSHHFAMCDDGSATTLKWKTGTGLGNHPAIVKVALRQKAGDTFRVHRVVLLLFHLWLGEL